MKLLFDIILICIFAYINSDATTQTINGCGLKEYRSPTSAEECKDDFEICCYINLVDSKNNNIKSYCFPAPEKLGKGDVDKEIEDATGYIVESLACFDFSENLKYMIGNLILIGLILF